MSRASALIAKRNQQAERGGERGVFIRGRYYNAGASITMAGRENEHTRGGTLDSGGREGTRTGARGLVYPTDDR